MAEKISVEIGLEGGTEVQRQLEDIGKSGQKAFSDIQGAAEQVNLTSAASEFQDLGNAGVDAFNQISQAAKSATIFESVLQGVKKVEGAFESLGTAATKLGNRLTRSLGPLGVVARSFGPVGIAAGVAAGAFIKFGNDVAKTLSSLTADAAKLNLTAQQFDKLRQSLTQAGIAPDAILPGLQKLHETLAQDFFPTDVITGLQRFIAQLERMPDSVERTQLAMRTLGDALGAQVIAGLQTGAISADNFAAALGRTVPATQQQIIEAQKQQQAINQMSAAWARFKAEVAAPILTPAFEILTNQINKLTADLRRLGQEIQLVIALWNLLTAPVDQQAAAAQKVVEAYNRLGQTAQGAAQQGTQGFRAWEQVLAETNAQATQLDKTLKGFKPWEPSMGTGAGPGFAHGGLLGGRGTGTSDSNLAWVSRGEHIMPARAVRQPGVLSFLEALRRSGGNLSRVLDGMSRFALGGLVPRPAMSFAGGGSVGSMSNVTIQFPDLPPIDGLRASSAVVDDLRKAAALAQVRSGGRKPSRYS